MDIIVRALNGNAMYGAGRSLKIPVRFVSEITGYIVHHTHIYGKQEGESGQSGRYWYSPDPLGRVGYPRMPCPLGRGSLGHRMATFLTRGDLIDVECQRT